MRWRYHLPHVWERPTAVWEDVYLMPEGTADEPRSIWLTVDALGDSSEPSHGSDRESFIADALERLGEKEFWIDGARMIVRAREFTKPELLEWVKIWLAETGLPVGDLVEALPGEFQKSNEHADFVSRANRGDA